jgi:hypothetical protein
MVLIASDAKRLRAVNCPASSLPLSGLKWTRILAITGPGALHQSSGCFLSGPRRAQENSSLKRSYRVLRSALNQTRILPS